MNALGALNKGVVVAVFVLLFIAGGFGWYRMMYTPAQKTLSTAKETLSAAEQALAAKRLEFKQLDKTGPDHKGLAEIEIAKRAIPRDEDGAEAMVEVELLAKRAGVAFTSVGVEASQAANSDPNVPLTGAQPLDMSIEAHATYTSLIVFLQQVQDLVDDNRGKVYVKGRLFNIVSLSIGQDDGSANAEEKTIPKGHLMFSLMLRTYAEAPSTPTSSTTSDPNAAAGGATTPSADPNAAAGGATNTTSNPNATQPAPGAANDPAASGSPAAPTTSTVPPGTS